MTSDTTTPKTKTVRPAAKGLICRHPNTGEILPENGGEWPDTIFTRRAIKRGDVIDVVAEKAAAKKATTTKKTTSNTGEH